MAKRKALPREIYAETYAKDAVGLDFDLIKRLIAAGKISGWAQRAGALSDGNHFVQVYLVMDAEEVKKLEKETS